MEEDDWFVISNIIENELFLGTKEAAERVDIINKHQIQSILSIIDCPINIPKLKGEHKHIIMSDIPGERIDECFEETINFLNGCKKPVLVHCEMGISRSSTLVIMYLVSQGKSLRNSYDLVFDKRPVIDPNNGFWYHLYCFTKKTRPDDSDTIDFIVEKWSLKKQEKPSMTNQQKIEYVELLVKTKFSWGYFLC
ncbi:protein-tyrosine-phosphatase [Entamoeba marina]